jgi:hypothetical protein
MGGRQKGSRNAGSAADRNTLVEAPYRIGFDGNGQDHVMGYFAWLAIYHPEVYGTEILGRGLDLELLGRSTDLPPLPTAAENNAAIEKCFGLPRPPRTAGNGRTTDRDATDGADPFADLTDIDSVMQVALFAPKKFCRQWGAAFLTVPKHLKGEARRAWANAANGA